MHYFFDSVIRKILAQPGFNRWTYFHKARRYNALYERMCNREGFPTGTVTPYSLRRLRDHYIDLCWMPGSQIREADDVAHDLEVHRHNHKYLRWASQFKFEVGTVITITKDHSSYAKEYGVGEQVIVTEIVTPYGNSQGFPHIKVARVRDGYRKTYSLDGDRDAVYDAAHFAIHSDKHWWRDTASESRIAEADMDYGWDREF